MDKKVEKQTLEELQARFEALCDEQEQLPREGFAKVFEVLDGMEETFTPQHPYTENEDIINKALEITGHSNDEAFCKAFKRNNQIMIEGKKIQAKGLEIFAMQQHEKIQEEPHSPNEWQFVPIRILAPKEIMDNVINPILETDAKEGKGLYGNITDIPEEDESLDEWFDIEAYGIKCSLEPLYRDLQNYGVVDSVLENDTIREYYLKVIKSLICFIRDNTDKPNKIRNHISKTLKGLDDIPGFGLLLQILLLQGLVKWFENVDLKKGDNGYNEACSLVQWIGEQLMKKEISFCYFRWGENDKKRLKPLCDYLYSTEVGKIVQNSLFEKQTDCSFIVDGENGAKRMLKKSTSDIKTTDENDLLSKQDKVTQRGRQSKTFRDCLQNVDKLQTLHDVMNGKKGKEVALIMKVAIQIGWITKPTFKAVEDEFGNIGNRSNYNKYINENNRSTNDEIDGMKQALLSS